MNLIKKGFATLLTVLVSNTTFANTQETCTADINFLKNQVKLLDTSVKNLTGFMVSGKDKAQLATINELKTKVEALSQNYQSLLTKVQNHPLHVTINELKTKLETLSQNYQNLLNNIQNSTSDDSEYIVVGTKKILNPCNSFGAYKVDKEVEKIEKDSNYCSIKFIKAFDHIPENYTPCGYYQNDVKGYDYNFLVSFEEMIKTNNYDNHGKSISYTHDFKLHFCSWEIKATQNISSNNLTNIRLFLLKKRF